MNEANVVLGIGRDVDDVESVSGSSDGEIVEEVVRVPWEARAVPPLAIPECS